MNKQKKNKFKKPEIELTADDFSLDSVKRLKSSMVNR